MKCCLYRAAGVLFLGVCMLQLTACSGKSSDPGEECGNGVVEGNEACDDKGESATCNADCTAAACGDGIVNSTAGETCDEEGASTACDPDCTQVQCGDGVVNTAAGEACDDAGESATCNADCTTAACGDGVINATAGEQCDDEGESASCDSDCTQQECGDGVLNTTAGEVCDDGGASDDCDVDCTPASCGDGVVNSAAGEACDDQGESATCNFNCTQSTCGDNIWNATANEACDTSDVGSTTCADISPFDSGTLSCDANCFGYDTAGCGQCGNVVIDGDEVCDGTNIGTTTCSDVPPFDSGTLTCDASSCGTYDTSGCGQCGNLVLDGDEVCDGTDTGIATCESLFYDSGTLSCDATCANFNVDGCGTCGNVLIDGDEVCDGTNVLVQCSAYDPSFDHGEVRCGDDCLALDSSECSDCGNQIADGAEACDVTDYRGRNCLTAGQRDGILKCNQDCTYDVSDCNQGELLQNDDGNCTQEMGCSDMGEGITGNPNELVECFTANTTPPFQLLAVSYAVGVSVPPPDSLVIEIYDWTGAGAPGAMVSSTPVDATELTWGAHSVALSTVIMVTSQFFCIGINGHSATDGYRIMKSTTTSAPGTSWVRAPSCAIPNFATVEDASMAGNWCIRAVVK